MRKQQTKSTIGKDPFATVIPVTNELEFTEAPQVAKSQPIEAKQQRTVKVVNSDVRREVVNRNEADSKVAKQKLTVHLSFELADRVKNAAYWNPRLTIAAIAEQGIKNAIEKFEREHGGKYPPRDGELIGGRPIK